MLVGLIFILLPRMVSCHLIRVNIGNIQRARERVEEVGRIHADQVGKDTTVAAAVSGEASVGIVAEDVADGEACTGLLGDAGAVGHQDTLYCLAFEASVDHKRTGPKPGEWNL
jgi:hypothetical protein